MTYREEDIRAKLETTERELVEERAAGAQLVQQLKTETDKASRVASTARPSPWSAALTRVWGAEDGWREELRKALSALGMTVGVGLSFATLALCAHDCNEQVAAQNARQAAEPPPVDECVEICERLGVPFMRRGRSTDGYSETCMCVTSQRVCRFGLRDGSIGCWTP